MVAKPGAYQTSFNAGELDPQLHGQTGLKQFFAGAAQVRNAEPVPQGGFDLPPRSRWRGSQRWELAAAEINGDATVIAIAAAGVVWTHAFGAPVDLSCFDLTWSADDAVSDRVLALDIFDLATSAWVQLGGVKPLPAAVTTRRFARPPAQMAAVSAVRLRLVADVASTNLNLAGFTAWTELRGHIQPVRARAFTVSRADAYVAILTARNADLWKAGVFVGAVALPYGNDVVDVSFRQRADTAFLNHADYPEMRLLRHGADDDWSLETSPIVKIPDVDYGGVYSNTDEVWQVQLTWTSDIDPPNGQGFVISVDGVDGNLVTVADGPDWAATAGRVKTALEAMEAVDPGVTVTEDHAGTRTATFTITFAGGENSGANFILSGHAATSTALALSAWRITLGEVGGEPLISADRGYAGTANFFQDRLVRAGFRSKPDAFAPSRTGEYFDMNIKNVADSGAYLIALDVEQAEKIIHVAQSKHLVIFTDEAEYFIADRTLTRNAAPNIVRSSTIGASARVRPVEQESSLLFINREETIVYTAEYNEVAQGYEANPISLLCSHLFDGVADACLQASASGTDAQRYWIVRAGGGVALGLLIRNQDVTAFVRWETDGVIAAVATDGANRVYALVQRAIGDTVRIEFEELEEGLLFDGAVSFSFDDPTAAITGLDMHEGRTVWAEADGYIDGPFTVKRGAITLTDAARAVTIGRWTPPFVETLPLVRDVGPHVVLKRPARVHTVQLDLIDTTSIAIGANGRAARDVPRVRMSRAADAPPAGVTGQVTVTGLKGFSDAGQVVITQTKPGRLQVRNITIQARL